MHLYERTCPVYKKQCQGYNADGSAAAPVHLMFGNGGFEFTWFGELLCSWGAGLLSCQASV